MKVVKVEGGGVTRVIERPTPMPKEGEVLIETVVSALCGSELHAWRGAGEPDGNGGHEAVGRVAQLGAGVQNLELGDNVGASAVVGCGTCEFCQKGEFTWCANFRGTGNMHAEYFVAAAAACFRLPDDLDWPEAVLITGDGLGVPYHTACKIASPAIHTVAIFGAGPIGLGNVLLQAHLGRRVIAVDIVPERLSFASVLGASHVINAKKGDVAAQIRDLTKGHGADVCIEAAGRPETALECFAAVKTAGTVVFNGEQNAVTLSPSQHFIRRDITAVGSWYYHFSEIEHILQLYRGGLRVSDLISHHFALKAAPLAYETFASGKSAKVLLTYPKT